MCAGGDTPDPHRVIGAAGDKCRRVHLLELGGRLLKISFELAKFWFPILKYDIYIHTITIKHVLEFADP